MTKPGGASTWSCMQTAKPSVGKLNCVLALSRFPCPPCSRPLSPVPGFASRGLSSHNWSCWPLLFLAAWGPSVSAYVSALILAVPGPSSSSRSPPTGVSCFPPLLAAISALSPCWFHSQLHLFIWHLWTSSSICFQTHPNLNTFHCICACSVLTFVTGMITVPNNLNLLLS